MIVIAQTRYGRLTVGFEWRDIWVGVYVSESAIFVCLLPCIVVRWFRR